MTTRTTRTTVYFKRPFRLIKGGEMFPAGAYPIEMDEELVQGLTFPAYRRTTTTMQLIADPRQPGTKESTLIDPLQLEAALVRDTAQSAMVEADEALERIAAIASDDGMPIATERRAAPGKQKS